MKKHLYITLSALTFLSVRLAAQTLDDYRSTAAGGNWSLAGTWERYDGSMWVAAVAAPSSANGVITIRSGASVAVDAAVTADQIIIDGTLTTNTGITLSIANGAGTDLQINGTGTVLNQGTITPATSTVFTCADGGYYIHNTISSVANPLVAFGATGLSAASNFVYRGSASLTPSISMAGRTYGNLYFESSSGLWAVNFTGGTTTTTVNGTVRVGVTNVGTVTYNETTPTGAFIINGGIQVATGSTFGIRQATTNAVTVNGNSVIDGTLSVQCQTFNNNGAITGNGIFRLAAPATTPSMTLGGSGSINISQIRISTAVNVTLNQPAATSYFIFFNTGNLNNASSLTLGLGSGNTFIQFGQTGGAVATGSFVGTPNFNLGGAPFLGIYYLEQIGSRTTGTEIPATRTVQELQVTNVNGVTLSGGNLALNGNLFLNGASGSHLTLGANDLSVTGSITASASAHVVTNSTGKLIRSVGGTAVLFPIGLSSGSYDPVSITNSGTTDDFGARVYGTVTSPQSPSLVVNREWDISEAIGGGSNCTLALTYDATASTGGLYSPAGSMVIGHYNGSAWTETSAAIAGTTVTASGFTAFSPYAVGNATGFLPLELLRFTGTAQPSSNLLEWATALEVDVERIDVERQLEGARMFEVVGSVAPKGTSGGTASYQFVDPNVRQSATYRLNIWDYSGKNLLSPAVFLARSGTGREVQVFPNPVESTANIAIVGAGAGNFKVQIVGANGQLVQEVDAAGIETGERRQWTIPAGQWSAGVYRVVLLRDARVVHSTTLVKN